MCRTVDILRRKYIMLSLSVILIFLIPRQKIYWQLYGVVKSRKNVVFILIQQNMQRFLALMDTIFFFRVFDILSNLISYHLFVPCKMSNTIIQKCIYWFVFHALLAFMRISYEKEIWRLVSSMIFSIRKRPTLIRIDYL